MSFDRNSRTARDGLLVDVTAVDSSHLIDISDAALEERRATSGIPLPRVAEPDLPEVIVHRPRPTMSERMQQFGVPPRPDRLGYAFITRTVDIILSLATLIVFAPVMVLLAALIRADSPGPSVFVQERVSRNGGTFRLAKFRTMHADARERFPELYAYKYTESEINSMKFKLPNDPRLTRVGRWLRRTSLDELPNLFNVLRGHMALVGPRPEVPEMTEYYEPRQLAKFAVKPGLTGLAQTRGRNILTLQQTITADLEYVHTRSLWLDIRILFRTVWTVAVQFGAL
jgi:lipopolysaccharide/colanic/teichoic acid biosynthesis glycosyltransferase